MAVTTNHRARELKAWNELPVTVAVDDFLYVDEEDRWDPRFVRYRGSWYDVMDSQGITTDAPHAFMVTADSELAAWDGITTDSMWSGVVFRFPKAYEAFIRGLDDRFAYIIVGRWTP